MARRAAVPPNDRHGDVRPGSRARAPRRRPEQTPDGPEASADRPNAPHRPDPAPAGQPPAISAVNSTVGFPSDHGGPGPRVRPSPGTVSRVGGCAPSHVSRAGNHRPSDGTPARSMPHVSAHSGSVADSTTISHSRTRSIRRPDPAVRRTIRCHGCGTAVLTTRITGWSTGRDRAHQRVRRPGDVTPWTTTTKGRSTRSRLTRGQARGGRISRGSANTNVSLAVVTGCTVP